MMLIDKGYFDYDFEKAAPQEPTTDWLDTIRSAEETRNIVAAFGIGVGQPPKPETLEDIQSYIIKQEHYGSSHTGSR